MLPSLAKACYPRAAAGLIVLQLASTTAACDLVKNGKQRTLTEIQVAWAGLADDFIVMALLLGQGAVLLPEPLCAADNKVPLASCCCFHGKGPAQVPQLSLSAKKTQLTPHSMLASCPAFAGRPLLC